MKISKIKLISPDDPSYRRIVSSILQSARKRRTREGEADDQPEAEVALTPLEPEESEREASRKQRAAAFEAEKRMRSWLQNYFPCSEERVLKYAESRHSRAREELKYKEIDAVLTEGNEPFAFVELKTTTTCNIPRQIYKARKQLRDVLKVAKLRWPNLFGVVILLDMAQLTGDCREQSAGVNSALSPAELALHLNTIARNAKAGIVSYVVDGPLFLGHTEARNG